MENKLIQSTSIQFLRDLSAHNNRDWFQTNKPLYLAAHQNMCEFVDGLILEMNKQDLIENFSGKDSLYRIYNDVRFSKDKQPYNPRFACSLQRATKRLRGGYYLNIKPGNCFLGCGFFFPNPADLKRIRLDIADNYSDWNTLLQADNIKNNFGEITGNKVATTPRGFSKDHPAIELLRLKQFIFRHEFTDEEVTSKKFFADVLRCFTAIRPYFDYMSEVLTTNMNGESLV